MSGYGTTLLHQAVVGGCTEALQLFLLASADPWDTEGEHDETPLHAAARSGNGDAVRILLNAVGPEAATALGDENWTPLHLAAEQGHLDVMEQLLEAVPEAAMASTSRGFLPLHLAASEGHTAVVQRLLQAAPAAAFAISGADESKPLHLAAAFSHAAVVQLLLEAAPAAAMARDIGGSTPLSGDATLRSPSNYWQRCPRQQPPATMRAGHRFIWLRCGASLALHKRCWKLCQTQPQPTMQLAGAHCKERR